MAKPRKDLVLIEDGEFEVVDANAVPVPNKAEDEVSAELQEMLRSNSDRKALKGHIQKKGRLVSKSWGSNTS